MEDSILGVPKSSEERRLRLEEKAQDFDHEMRRREMAVKENDAGRSKGISASSATVIGAVLTLLGGVLGAGISEYLKGRAEIALEFAKQNAAENQANRTFETNLILDAIKAPTREEAARNLKFFVDAGFLTDPTGKIASLLPFETPFLGEPLPASRQRAELSTGVIEVRRMNFALKCTATLVAPRRVITAAHCLDRRGESLAEQNSPMQLRFIRDETASPAHLIEKVKVGGGGIALIELDEPVGNNQMLSLSNTRMPVEGESIYLAYNDGETGRINLQTCRVLQSEVASFRHSCTTGPGASGALVVASKDDFVLGIHVLVKKRDDEWIGEAAGIQQLLLKLAPQLVDTAR